MWHILGDREVDWRDVKGWCFLKLLLAHCELQEVHPAPHLHWGFPLYMQWLHFSCSIPSLYSCFLLCNFREVTAVSVVPLLRFSLTAAWQSVSVLWVQDCALVLSAVPTKHPHVIWHHLGYWGPRTCPFRQVLQSVHCNFTLSCSSPFCCTFMACSAYSLCIFKCTLTPVSCWVDRAIGSW